jgi:antitoxin MazE
MKTQIIKIGNSKGIRIPQALLEQCHLDGKVELEAQLGQLVVRPAKGPREGWAAAFKKMARYGDDELLDKETLTTI